MKKNVLKKNRLDVFDGLRGISVLLVFLNHIDSYYIIHAAPPFFQQYISFFFLSGKLGVSFFFILSGFLMAFLYPTPDTQHFIAKRYARIFPPFITLVISMSIFRSYPHLSLFLRIVILFAIAYVFRFIWSYGVEKYNKGKLVFTLFLMLQIAMVIWYGFFIMRMPAIWFHSLPTFIQIATTGMANATLTLPFGTYIPFLDIVYWSLICEVLFYLLYPSIIVPFIRSIQNKSTPIKMLGFGLLFPFFFGTSLLFKELRGFGSIEIEYFIYFCVGILVAQGAKNKKTIEVPFSIKWIFHPLIFLFFLFCAYTISLYSIQLVHLVVILLLSIPLGALVYFLLDDKTVLSRFFSNKVCAFLGTISYSLYICSTPLIDGMRLLYKPTNGMENVIFLCITLIISIAVSYVMYIIIEIPYFMFKPARQDKINPEKNSMLPFFLLMLFFIGAIFSTYSSRFNFFSTEKNYTKEMATIQPPHSLLLSEKPLYLHFKSYENNLGVVLIHISNPISSSELNNNKMLIMKLREKNSETWHAIQETNLANIESSISFPFGFPNIGNSKNHEYVLEIRTRNIIADKNPTLQSSPNIISTIHQRNKRELVTHPSQLMIHALNKIKTFLENKSALISITCIFPLLLLMIFLSYRAKNQYNIPHARTKKERK